LLEKGSGTGGIGVGVVGVATCIIAEVYVSEMKIRKTFGLIGAAVITCTTTPCVANDQLPSRYIIRGYEGTPGYVSCIPKGNFIQSRITKCKESMINKATLRGYPGTIAGYTTPGGELIEEFYTDDTYANCSLYQQGCKVLIQINKGGYKLATKIVAPFGRLTAITYYLGGQRILSIVEDRS
jgi:hypothetical protein